jgi:hypothetical protein
MNHLYFVSVEKGVYLQTLATLFPGFGTFPLFHSEPEIENDGPISSGPGC